MISACRCAIAALPVVGAIAPMTMASQTLYDIDFAAPFHQSGMPATIDLGDTPRVGPTRNSFQHPTVVDSFGPMTDGALHFRSPDESSFLSQIELGVESGFTGVGVDYPGYRLEFDMIVDEIGPVSDDFTVLFDTPRVNTFTFRGDGLIQYGNAADFIGTFEVDTLLHVAVEMMTDDNTWRIMVNGAELYSGPTRLDATEGLDSIRLSLSDREDRETSVYVDNIKVYGIPSPSALPVLAVLFTGIRRSRACG